MRTFYGFTLIGPFVALLVLSLGYIGFFLWTLFEQPSLLLPVMLLGLVLGFLWLLWIRLSATLGELLFGRDKRGMRK
jgi:hypothetical protein